MSEQRGPSGQESHDRLCRRVAQEEARKLRARQRVEQGIWFGLGMFGIVGWSVAIPTLIGVALGIWIDTRWPSRFSWTLMLLFMGLLLGCLQAYYWLSLERRIIEREKRDEDCD
jgi:ATP synthase protein I